ncbi:type II toxin-antitoxin system RelE/ParE family toxin [Mucilaginibacter gotjawali]|uniref:Plasmid stabilization system protein ParE n=1 Tax=Mucilaginibacter gotjawali TaxID=1550579 RepID=A0A839SGS7_9SPHI|nr:type II toxin-antitoxin system RelE/ParE family toxin [Mucilaginibacter gotjawali]MBB3057026.1 plasmid stabilization system protein ParE [Mucilaginibacter gotjawali]
MAEKVPHKIIYTQRSLANIRAIRSYLLYKFTQKEVDNLYRLINEFESVVAVFPQLYPLITGSKKVRRAVLSKQLSVFYTFSKDALRIAAILDNRMDNAKWPR